MEYLNAYSEAVEDITLSDEDVYAGMALFCLGSADLSRRRRGSESPPVLAVKTTQVCESCHMYIYAWIKCI